MKYEILGDLGELISRVTAGVLDDDAAVVCKFRGHAIVTVCCLTQDHEKMREALADVEFLLQEALGICQAMQSSTDAEWESALQEAKSS